MAVTVAGIDEAINAIGTSGQSFTLDGVTYNAGNLKTLWQMRQDLTEETARTDGSRPTMRGIRMSGMGY